MKYLTLLALAVAGTLAAQEFDPPVTMSLKIRAPSPLPTKGPANIPSRPDIVFDPEPTTTNRHPHKQAPPPRHKRYPNPLAAPKHGCDLCCHCPGGTCSDTCKPLPPLDDPPKIKRAPAQPPNHGCGLCCNCPSRQCSETCPPDLSLSTKNIAPALLNRSPDKGDCGLCCHLTGQAKDDCLNQPAKRSPILEERDCSKCPMGTCHTGCGLDPPKKRSLEERDCGMCCHLKGEEREWCLNPDKPAPPKRSIEERDCGLCCHLTGQAKDDCLNQPKKRSLEERNCHHICCGLKDQALKDCMAAQYPATPVKRHQIKPTLPARSLEERNCHHLCCGLTGQDLKKCEAAAYPTDAPKKRSDGASPEKRHHTKPTLPLALAQPTLEARSLDERNCQHLCCGLTGQALKDCMAAEYPDTPKKRSEAATPVSRKRSLEERNCLHLCCGLEGEALKECMAVSYPTDKPKKRSIGDPKPVPDCGHCCHCPGPRCPEDCQFLLIPTIAPQPTSAPTPWVKR
jgi:hypothetical protein